MHSIREWKRAVDQLRGRATIESSSEESRGFDSIRDQRKSKREAAQLQLLTKDEERRSSSCRVSHSSLEVILVASKIHAEPQPVSFAREEKHPPKPVTARQKETGRQKWEEERSQS